ncbi:helix-turn-helix transcriptional regulator [Erwinia sp. SLM-02]|uniref:helix-turn-helix transcriptional regulator n=1 Tax=Erwinia sp. SLM-02 TaxID=3020057 RepID=UPI0028D2BBD6|nr:helix-turn-helix transcriptional regulator [uncultured Erwinia sp.]
MSRPTELYVPHVLDAADIPPELRYQQISQNISCYGIDVADDRRPEEIIAQHKTISGTKGDFCSAWGSRNITVFDPHKTEQTSLYFSLLLEGSQIISGRKKSTATEVTSGSLMVHERNDYYTYRSDDVRQLYLLPDMEAVKEIFDGRLPGPMLAMENHHLKDFMVAHMLLLHSHSAAMNVKSTSLILDGLHNMALLMLADVAKEQGLLSSGNLSHVYNAARSYIAQNYSRHDLSPDSISQELRYSRSSLDRAFKEQRTTVMAVIKEIRLIKAREMLEKDIHLRIEQIAWRCGFSSAFIFSKNFREKYKVPPTVWRDNFNPSN